MYSSIDLGYSVDHLSEKNSDPLLLHTPVSGGNTIIEFAIALKITIFIFRATVEQC